MKTMEKYVRQYNRKRGGAYSLEYVDAWRRGSHVLKCTEKASGEARFILLPGRDIDAENVRRQYSAAGRPDAEIHAFLFNYFN